MIHFLDFKGWMQVEQILRYNEIKRASRSKAAPRLGGKTSSGDLNVSRLILSPAPLTGSRLDLLVLHHDLQQNLHNRPLLARPGCLPFLSISEWEVSCCQASPSTRWLVFFRKSLAHFSHQRLQNIISAQILTPLLFQFLFVSIFVSSWCKKILH